jgi:glutamate N-acetyltransferase/amino-acid N-acetyltransferase
MVLGAGICRTELPKGFLANGINCGVRAYRPDLGVIISECSAVTVGVFTQSTCKAAPVLYSEQCLPSTSTRAIITNSGQANAATGAQGVRDNFAMVAAVAEQLQCQPEQVMAASTGVIGAVMEIDKITAAIPELVKTASTIAEKFAVAILTTDLIPKTVMKEVQLSTGKVMITGICKGSGMIHPNMATMLGYLLTDAQLTVTQAQHLLTESVNHSFNMISVDGEMSTNDCTFLMANGASGVALSTPEDINLFAAEMLNVAITLAKSIARDGEGASKLIEVQVTGAPTVEIARQVARSLTVSPLIKTAINGESPNWGRVLARLGAEQIATDILSKTEITFAGFCVYSYEQLTLTDAKQLTEAMKQDTIPIAVALNSGSESATAWGCDLSEKYVKINAGYLS